jgi:hypothetical protein
MGQPISYHEPGHWVGRPQKMLKQRFADRSEHLPFRDGPREATTSCAQYVRTPFTTNAHNLRIGLERLRDHVLGR